VKKLLCCAAGALAASGCSFILDFDRFRDAGTDDDAGTVTVSLACGEAPAAGAGTGCVLDEGLGTGLRAVPAELRGSAPLFDASVIVTVPAGSAVIIAEVRAPTVPSSVVGLTLRVPVDETMDTFTVDVPLTVTLNGEDLGPPLTLTVRYHPELFVDVGSSVTSDAFEFSNVTVTQGFRATGTWPLEIVAYGDVHVAAGASINVDGLAGGVMAGGPGAAGAAGGPGGAAGNAPGAAGSGVGGGAGGLGFDVATGAPAQGGGGAGHRAAGGGSGSTLGGPTYGDGRLEPFGPEVAGSGGGGGGGPMGPGGAGGHGGGALRIRTEGAVLFEGVGARVSADGALGAPASVDGMAGGGGSGGAVWISAAEGVLGASGTISAAGAPGPAGAGSDGFVRLDVPNGWEPATIPGVDFNGLAWDPALPELAATSSVTAALGYGPLSAGDVEVLDATGAVVFATSFTTDGMGRTDVVLTLVEGLNVLHACSPDCVAPLDEDRLAVVYVR
jgi:hypothetical protein